MKDDFSRTDKCLMSSVKKIRKPEGLRCCFDLILMVLNEREAYTLDVLREISSTGYLSFSISFLKSFCGGLSSKP